MSIYFFGNLSKYFFWKFVHIFFLKICPNIFFKNLSIFGKFLKIFLILFENLFIFGKYLRIFLILFFETSQYLANSKDLSNLVKLLFWSSSLVAVAVAESMDHT